MAQKPNADDDGLNMNVAVECDCPECGSEETFTKETTADLFTDADGYSSRCSECGFWFRAFGLVEDDEDEENETRRTRRRNFTRRTRTPSTGDKNESNRVRESLKGL